MNTNKGQALLETLIIIPILAAMIYMISFTCDIVLTKQQLVMASRYGTDLIFYTELNSDQVKNEILDYLSGKEIMGRRVDSKQIDVNVKIERFPALRGISLDNLYTIMESYFTPQEHTSFVEIKYRRDVPDIVSILNIFFRSVNNTALPKEITVSARSEVLAGTGA